MKDKEEMPTGRAYVEILKIREGLDNLLVPTDKIEALNGALDSSLKLVSDIALMAAAIESNLTAICRKLDKLAEDPVVGERVTAEFQDLVALKTKLLDGAFHDTVDFVRKFERMSRDALLRQAGIDPNDEEAAMAYLLKLGQAVVIPGVSPQN